MPQAAPVRSSAKRPSIPSPLTILRLQRQLQRLVCSAPWFDHCWAAVAVGRVKARKRLDAALDHALLYPPGGAPRPGRRGTLMRRCKRCGCKWYPPQYVRNCRLCEDCSAAEGVPFTHEKNHVSSTHSPTGIALQMLAHYKVRLIESRLAAEDEQSLLREIAAAKSPARAAQDSLRRQKNTKKHA